MSDIKETTGRTLRLSDYIKALTAGQAKCGKTSFLVGSLLGVLPWQEFGGVVSSPKHLHVVALDQDALDGIQEFLVGMCKAPDESLDFNVYNLLENVHAASLQAERYGSDFYNMMHATILRIHEKIAQRPGVHALVVSSYTTMARAVETEVRGAPTDENWKPDYGRDWNMVNAQLNRLQNAYQRDLAHVFWEGHVQYVAAEGSKDMKKTVPVLKVHGQAGQEWANNTSHNLLIRRDPMAPKVSKNGVKLEVDRMYLEVKGGGTAFLTGGRRVAGLSAQEADMTVALKKMGYKVGQWGWKGKK